MASKANTARCRWVPGTMNRVNVTLPLGNAAHSATVTLQSLLAAVPEAADKLYLQGRADFPCDERLFSSLTAEH